MQEPNSHSPGCMCQGIFVIMVVHVQHALRGYDTEPGLCHMGFAGMHLAEACQWRRGSMQHSGWPSAGHIEPAHLLASWPHWAGPAIGCQQRFSPEEKL